MFKNTAELRQSLMQDLIDLREGKVTNATARARASVARSILSSVSIEIQAANLGKSFEPVSLEAIIHPKRLNKVA